MTTSQSLGKTTLLRYTGIITNVGLPAIVANDFPTPQPLVSGIEGSLGLASRVIP